MEVKIWVIEGPQANELAGDPNLTLTLTIRVLTLAPSHGHWSLGQGKGVSTVLMNDLDIEAIAFLHAYCCVDD